MKLEFNAVFRRSLFQRLSLDERRISQRMKHALAFCFEEVEVTYLAMGIFLISLEQGYPDLENTKDLIWDLLLEQFDGEVEEDNELEVSIVYP